MTISNSKVFISYPRSDGEWVNAFAESLTARGIDPWLDLWSLTSDAPMMNQLEDAIRESAFLIAVLPSDGSTNPNVLFEVGVAIGMKMPFVLIVGQGDQAPKLPQGLMSRMNVVRSDPDKTAAVVESVIHRRLAPIGVLTTPVPSPAL